MFFKIACYEKLVFVFKYSYELYRKRRSDRTDIYNQIYNSPAPQSQLKMTKQVASANK